MTFSLRLKALGDEFLDIVVALGFEEFAEGLEVFAGKKLEAGDQLEGVDEAQRFGTTFGDAFQASSQGEGEHDQEGSHGEHEDGDEVGDHSEWVMGSAMTL